MASGPAPGFTGNVAKVGDTVPWTLETGNGFDCSRCDEVIVWIGVDDNTNANSPEIMDFSFDVATYAGSTSAPVWGPLDASDGVTIADSLDEVPLQYRRDAQPLDN